jgi:hypothetical protein
MIPKFSNAALPLCLRARFMTFLSLWDPSRPCCQQYTKTWSVSVGTNQFPTFSVTQLSPHITKYILAKVSITSLHYCVNCYCHVIEWLQTGFGLVIGFIAHLYTQFVTYTSQTGHIRSLQSVTFFTRRCLIAVSNDGRFSLSGFSNCPRPQLPDSNNSSQILNVSNPLTN